MNHLIARTDQQLEIREAIESLEESMRDEIDEGKIEQTHHDGATQKGNEEATHYFGDGVYVRGVQIPAGSLVIGKIHKQARVCIIAKGECRFLDEYHQETVKAPWCGEFLPGTKTAVLALTDTVWYACVGTDLKDPIEILEILSAPTYKDFVKYALALENDS